jgi:hypothetical protein
MRKGLLESIEFQIVFLEKMNFLLNQDQDSDQFFTSIK